MQSLHNPSLFLTKIVGTPHDDTLGCISPKSNNSFNCIFNSCNLGVDIRYGVLEIGFVPSFRSIANSNYLFKGKPGSSLGKTLENYDTTGKYSNIFVSPFLLRDKMAYILHPLCIFFFNCREVINLRDTPLFIPTITLLFHKSLIKINIFVSQLSIASFDSNQSIPTLL